MLKFAAKAQVSELRDRFADSFARAGAEAVRRRLTTPGGGMGERKLHWLPELRLWAYFSRRPVARRWLCWFGSDIGGPAQALTPSIEINLSVLNIRAAAGRALTDEEGKVYLAHKGILGGGRGGQMKMDEFGRLMRGFVREPVMAPSLKEEFLYILGNPADRDFLTTLQRFVVECERLRKIARSQRRDTASASRQGARQRGGREYDLDGLGYGGPRDEYVIKHVHGRVVNQLEDILKARGYAVDKPPQSSMLPDLCVMGSDGRMEVLFEVKVGSATHDWFEAIGQLIVYSACEPQTPKRVLVCPAPRRTDHFKVALRTLGIKVLIFSEDEGKVTFYNLDTLLPGPRAGPHTNQR